MSAAGKTIARVEENAPGSQGRPDEAVIVLHFTDGTALEIVGSGDGYENGYINHELLSVEDVARRARDAEAYRQQEQTKARERQEWLALTCEQRAAQRSGDTSLIGAWLHIEILRTCIVSERDREIRMPCKQCGECECPNAPVEIIPGRATVPSGRIV